MDPNSPYAPRPEGVRPEYRRAAQQHETAADGSGANGWTRNELAARVALVRSPGL
jgi:3-oxoacid CoA-transferase subunit B